MNASEIERSIRPDYGKRNEKKLRKHLRQHRRLKTYHILRQANAKRQREKEAQRQRDAEKRKHKREGIRFGTWNTRRVGSDSLNFDPFMKTKCLFTLFEKRKWQAALLTDVDFFGDSFRQYDTGNQQWIMIVRGKVAIAITGDLIARWRRGGQLIYDSGKKLPTELWR